MDNGKATPTRQSRSGRSLRLRRFEKRRPAPGYRHSHHGTLAFVGNAGYSWASSVTESNAYFLSFEQTTIYSQNNIRRANGYQVRCLQE